MKLYVLNCRPFNSKLWLAGLMAYGLGAGCVTNQSSGSLSDGSRGDEVIERSKEQAPQWIELDPGVLHVGELELKFIQAQTRVLDLPLGVKQVQLDAMTASEAALRQKLRERLYSVAGAEGIPLSGPIVELDQLLADVTKDVHGAHAHVGDIYFEKLVTSNDGKPLQYYNIYVIVAFARSNIPELASQLSRRLLGTKDGILIRLGQALAKAETTSLSH